MTLTNDDAAIREIEAAWAVRPDRCVICDKPLVHRSTGRKRWTCSDRCRQRRHRRAVTP